MLRAFLTPQILVGLVAVGLMSAGITWWRRERETGVRRLGLFGLSVSIGVVLLVTLFRELPTGACTACLTDWHVDKLLAGTFGADVALNVALFVAPAMLAVLLWRHPIKTVLVAAAGSFAIEFVQPLVGVGANDVVDLVANTVGAIIGALGATLILLLADSFQRRQVGWARLFRTAAGLLAVAVLTIGYPGWVATARQADAATQLDQMFGGSTLADYNAHRDTDWDNKLLRFATDNGPLTAVSYRTDQVARERFTWTLYFAIRCVIAEWTPSGYSTVQESGTDCTTQLQP
jgi:hypothetical protein